MSTVFELEVNRLRKALLAEAALVEEAIGRAIQAFMERDDKLAEEVIKGDHAIDLKEVEVEEECLKILALHQPVAKDLRFIVAVLKMNNDLERMGDIAVSIARRALYLARRGQADDLRTEIRGMADMVSSMVGESLDALINADVALARRVCAKDDDVDAMKRKISEQIRDLIQREPARTPVLLKVLDLPRHLERLADLATNIAEDVIYLVEGEITRHQRLPAQQDDAAA
jgi:phosphate transport system protein